MRPAGTRMLHLPLSYMLLPVHTCIPAVANDHMRDESIRRQLRRALARHTDHLCSLPRGLCKRSAPSRAWQQEFPQHGRNHRGACTSIDMSVPEVGTRHEAEVIDPMYRSMPSLAGMDWLIRSEHAWPAALAICPCMHSVLPACLGLRIQSALACLHFRRPGLLCRSWRYFDSRLSAVRYLIAACSFYGGKPLSLSVWCRLPVKVLSHSAK
jgi:hypothetical protein